MIIHLFISNQSSISLSSKPMKQTVCCIWLPLNCWWRLLHLIDCHALMMFTFLFVFAVVIHLHFSICISICICICISICMLHTIVQQVINKLARALFQHVHICQCYCASDASTWSSIKKTKHTDQSVGGSRQPWITGADHLGSWYKA